MKTKCSQTFAPVEWGLVDRALLARERKPPSLVSNKSITLLCAEESTATEFARVGKLNVLYKLSCVLKSFICRSENPGAKIPQQNCSKVVDWTRFLEISRMHLARSSKLNLLSRKTNIFSFFSDTKPQKIRYYYFFVNTRDRKCKVLQKESKNDKKWDKKK